MSGNKTAPSLRRAWSIVLCVGWAGCAMSSTVSEDAPATRAALCDDAPCEPESKAEEIALGQRIFEDRNLSASGTESCASCHEAQRAFTGNNKPGDPLFPTSIGAFDTLVGLRNAPTLDYMMFSPLFSFSSETGKPSGGQFWDGRAESLEQQARQPFLDRREMALPDVASLITRIASADYAPLFQRVYGDILNDPDLAYDKATRAIAAFERSERFAKFSSKFDGVLRGEAAFSEPEARGFALFKDPQKGNCIACHAGTEGSSRSQDWLFTDFSYDNLGIPRNPEVPDNANTMFYDLGVCKRRDLPSNVAGDSLCGAFKVPTLRNVALTAPYMHNGYFQDLRDVVAFYATRDTDPGRWYPTAEDGSVKKFDDLPAQYVGNVNREEVPYDRKPGEEPRLSPDEIDDVVAFLQTLTDN